MCSYIFIINHWQWPRNTAAVAAVDATVRVEGPLRILAAVLLYVWRTINTGKCMSAPRITLN